MFDVPRKEFRARAKYLSVSFAGSKSGLGPTKSSGVEAMSVR